MTHILTRTLLTTAMLMAGNLLLPAAPAYSESAEEARLRDEADNDQGHQNVRELLTQGTNPNVRGFKGRTAVHAAAGGCAKQNLEVILKHGGDATVRDTDGNTPLHHAAGAIGGEMVCAPVTRLLVQHDAPVNQANQDGNTALHLAAKGSNEDRLAVLFDAGANPRAINGDGLTPLQLFVKDGANEGRVAALLLDAGADPDRKTPAGYTPLHVTLKSVGRGKTEVVEALLAGNADPCIRDPEGHIPYQYGKVHENENAMVRDLLDRAGGHELACEKQKVRRGYLGVTIRKVTQELAEQFGSPYASGVVIIDVREGYPAEAGGLQSGDMIRRYNGTTVKDLAHLRSLTQGTPPGTTVTLTILHDGVSLGPCEVDGRSDQCITGLHGGVFLERSVTIAEWPSDLKDE